MVLALLLLCVINLGFALPLVPIASDDIRMVDVFSADEASAAAAVRYLHALNTLEIRSFSYGGLFYYIPLGALKLWSVAGGEVTDRVVVIVMRLVCTAAGLGCLWVTYRIGCEAFSRTVGLVGACLVVINPVFLRWSVEIHPDLPQLFWVLLALLWCCRLCRRFSVAGAALAALFAGLAFGTKYSGVFLVPVIAAALLLPSEDGRPILGDALSRLRERRYVLALVLVPAVFVLTFLATNPYAWISYETFRADLAFEQAHLSFGHVFRADRAGLDWLVRLADLVGTANGVALALYLGLIITFHLSGRRRLPIEKILLLIWIGGFTGYLVLTANIQAPRHLLPILPPVLLFLADGYREVWHLATERWPRVRWLAIAVPLVLACLSWSRGAEAVRMFQDKLGREDGSPEIAAGRWIAERFPETTSIIFDAYAYVPVRYERVYRTFGQSYPVVNHFRPDLLVVREAIASRYGNPGDADRAQMGADAFMDRHDFYRYLREGRVSAYEAVRDSGRVAVYRRRVSNRDGSGELPDWVSRMRMFAAGKLYGQAEARVTMGDIHASLGRWAEAEREFRMAKEAAPNHPTTAYKLARVDLVLGRLPEAAKGFDEVLSLIATAPVQRRAAACHTIASHYSDGGYGEDAIRWAREALRHDPAHRAALFDLGAFYLAGGRPEAADSTYAAAVRLHGPDERAAGRLREMIEKGGLGDSGSRILETYFDGGRRR